MERWCEATFAPASARRRPSPREYPFFTGAGTNFKQLTRVLTTQFIVPPNICAQVYSRTQGYERSNSNFRATPISSDIVFSSSSEAQLAAQTLALAGDPDHGYSATADIVA